MLDFQDGMCYTLVREQTDGLVLGQSPSFIINSILIFSVTGPLLVFFLSKNITYCINKKKNTPPSYHGVFSFERMQKL